MRKKIDPFFFIIGNEFFEYIKDTFDQLYEEGCKGKPKMMTVGLHGRVVGRPGRAKGLIKFLDYISQFQDIWVCRRVDVARHWHKVHPPEHLPIKQDINYVVQQQSLDPMKPVNYDPLHPIRPHPLQPFIKSNL